jgi:hypothetical protein
MYATTVQDMAERPYGTGLKPGQVHSGSFKKGFDPRRVGGTILYDGMTVAQMARQQGPKCIQLLARVVDDESAPLRERIAAADKLLDRGFGKAVSVVDMNVTHSRDIRTLTRDELRAIAAGEAPRLPITLDGEAVGSAVSNAVQDFDEDAE